jgi:hypothetical protein
MLFEKSKLGAIMRRIKQRSHYLVLLVFICSCCCLPAVAGDVTLAWNAVSASNLAGYRVYYGTSTGSYGTPLSAGTKTTYTVSSSYLQAGKTYYFAVTAYDSSGNESSYSNEVSKTIPTCDINGDASVNVLDLQKLSNIILGNGSYSAAFDLNGDGSINVLELQTLSNVILGLRSCP